MLTLPEMAGFFITFNVGNRVEKCIFWKEKRTEENLQPLL
jgi:hypothetical protein